MHGKKSSLYFLELFQELGIRGNREQIFYVLYNCQDLMQGKSGITLTSTVNFILNPELKKFHRIYREIHKTMLKIFVEIRFEVLRVYYYTIVRSKYSSSIKYEEKILKKCYKIL